MDTASDLARLIRDLGLAPHPEGGWYRELHRSPGTLALERGPRSALTVIDYVVEAGSFSAFHRVASEEVWTWCGGAPLDLHLLDAAGTHRIERLGPAAARSFVVPAMCWQAAEPAGEGPGADPHEGPGYSWCACIVAPGFDFADFELADGEALAAELPAQAALIRRLTRPLND